ncbi:MAG: L-2-amino-thiazoline-4-carboxylic acid hydrolase [Saccharofermentans sp.]|nr:L-2-amino-thiazoline-4-carboxylic acid hydrolase [Saccharofermentans sp.]
MDQQKQIHKWLKKVIGDDAERVFKAQSSVYSEYAASLSGRTPNQYKTLTKTILPRVALYKALKADEKLSESAYDLTHKYMVEVIGKQKHKSTAALEIVPCFYRVYSRTFLKIMRTTDLQKSDQTEDKDFYDITITDCLWHNACKEFGCPELCSAFCDVDDVTYGNLRKLGFTRTQTLGKGGECCDFHFYKK